MEVIVATRNAGKLREIEAALLSSVPGLRLTGLAECPALKDPEESGATFAENAALKAAAVALALGVPCIADDSGIEVDALGGFPGVRSARWAGPDASDGERNERLIEKLRAAGAPEPAWTARFVCCMALAVPGGAIHTFVGTIEGVLIPEPRGHNGFGYDPIFLVPSLGLTTAEITREQKNAISHRGRALAALAAALPGILGE